jgi:AcrR family transcriptional regulator
MGIKQRHERDREAVRRAILDAARDLFVSEGYQNVSLRKIAERIEYSPAAIYGYFAGKDDIFFALAEEGFRLLGDPQRTEAADARPSASPLDRLRGIFWHFYEFSRQHPQYFLLMFVDRSVPRISREYERFAFAREIKGHFVAEIRACVEEQLLPATVEPYVVLRLIMMGLIGVAMMRLSDRLGASENADLLAEDMLNVILAGLRSGVTVKSTGTVGHAPDETDQALQAS